MPIQDQNLDAIYAKMVAAHEGDPQTWGRVNRALRDIMVDHAVRRCAYYRKVVPGNGAFGDIPVLTREVIRERFDDLLAEGIPEERRVLKQTSGSTGKAIRFYRDSSQGPIEYLSAQRFLKRLHGVTEDVATAWVAITPPDREPPLPWWSLRNRLRRPSLYPIPILGITPSQVAPTLGALSRLDPYFVYGHASGIGWIADQMEERGLSLRAGPRCVVTTADSLTSHAQERIARVFHAPVHSWYGLHELNGYVADTLPGTRRYAFNPLLVHVEVLDDRGDPVPPGRSGRLVLTDLNNFVMPFIRYDTGDTAIPSARPAGGFPVMEEIVGRSAEVLPLGNGRFITPASVNNRLTQSSDVGLRMRFFQCAQVSPNELELRVAWRPPVADDLRKEAIDALRSLTGVGTTVRVKDVTEPDRLPSGKVWIVRREF
jgi:phenylacetate-CoA ligase